MHNFGPAAEREEWVYGAQRPSYPSSSVDQEKVSEWINFMKEHDISRVVCLLNEEQLEHYPDDLLKQYRQEFGDQNVLHAPIQDYRLCEQEMMLTEILPFLDESMESKKKVVVHCSYGSGRTGHVLAGWLAHSRKMTPLDAIKSVKNVKGVKRNPEEGVQNGYATSEELMALLAVCR